MLADTSSGGLGRFKDFFRYDSNLGQDFFHDLLCHFYKDEDFRHKEVDAEINEQILINKIIDVFSSNIWGKK